ncbi:hypothetical protein L9F63_018948, partial [Diploptera punctata]
FLSDNLKYFNYFSFNISLLYTLQIFSIYIYAPSVIRQPFTYAIFTPTVTSYTIMRLDDYLFK